MPLLSGAQNAFGDLHINKVKAALVSNGDLFWDYVNAGFEVPADSGRHTILAGALWIGALDAGNQLRMAGQTYRQTGNDFFAGPVSSASVYNSAYDAQWAQLWPVRKTMIDSFRLGLYGMSIPAVIQNWPGNGNVSQGQAAQLAPYVDVNADNVYTPSNGDYPCIKGDGAVFFLFNDDRNTHTETGGQKLGIEIHGMMYGFKMPGTVLDSTIFIHYKIINRSANNYHDVRLGHFADFDIGLYSDDYIGCDVSRGMFFGYNGDAVDGQTSQPQPGAYGADPPSQSIMLLRGPEADPGDSMDNDFDGTVDETGETCALSRFVYYNNDFTVTGNPVTPMDYYNYLGGTWKDGSPITYGGTGYGGSVPAWFMFPDDSDPLGLGTNGVPQAAWNEFGSGNLPFDRRGLGSCGPFTLSAGEEICVDFGYVFARGTGGFNGWKAARSAAADQVRAFFDSTATCNCQPWPLGIDEPALVQVGLYPNPVADQLTIDFEAKGKNARYQLSDLSGRIVAKGRLEGNRTTLDVSSLPASVYLVKIVDETRVAVGKFVRR